MILITESAKHVIKLPIHLGNPGLIQSTAIIEYLEETHPEPPLLPADPAGRARVRGLAGIIACDIHPLNGVGTLGYMRDRLNVDEDGLAAWYQRWVRLGFEVLEGLLAGDPATGAFCQGDAPGLADICLIPQIFIAQGRGCDIGPYPTLVRIYDTCMEIEAFQDAQPSRLPEAAEIS